jgi:hypothetical protein
VVAPRKYRGAFPVYAVREGPQLKCYEIGDRSGTKSMKYNRKTIASNGSMA